MKALRIKTAQFLAKKGLSQLDIEFCLVKYFEKAEETLGNGYKMTDLPAKVYELYKINN
jgi:hypothetical protein